MDISYNALGKIFGGGKEEPQDTASENTSSRENNEPLNPASASTVSKDTTTDETQVNFGAKDATLDSTTAEAVEHDHVTNMHEEKVQHVVNKERHQDHYHTTVQPIKESEARPTEHDYKETATEGRSVNHDDVAATKAELDAEQAQFSNTKTINPTLESKTDEGTVTGNEEVHLHLHETVQPVIEKEIVKPSVTHTKVPVHEVHQEASVVHGTSVAAPMSAEEFKNAGHDLPSSKVDESAV